MREEATSTTCTHLDQVLTVDPSVLPEPRESADAGLRALAADPGDLSGLRPWLESFQQQLGPSTTGELPEVRDRS